MGKVLTLENISIFWFQGEKKPTNFFNSKRFFVVSG